MEFTMQYTFLGKTGMKVLRLCLGTMNFACHTSEQDCFRMMNEALDMGINIFDAADAYGAGLEETLKQFEEIFPCPGGEAPKAYAW